MGKEKDALQERAEQVANTCYAVRLRVFNRRISRVYNEVLSPRGLTISQFNILTAIVKCEPVAPQHISKVLHIEKSSLSRNIELMCKNGWVRKERKGAPVLLSTTEKGRRVYRDALPFWEDAQKKVLRLAGREIFQQMAATMVSLHTQ